ncbi:MAG TPA: hypothetical protein PJ990_20600, partial [Saprospiraceae bacterium]|nr:hypothetical protein [Saprospiraceae bacterium]
MSSDSNFVHFTYKVVTRCDAFTSGTSAWFEATGADPCESTVRSMFIDSDPIIIENANPVDFAQFFVIANTMDLYCGQADTLELTYLNISPFGETNNSHLCVNIDAGQLEYMTGGFFFINPAGYNPAYTETQNGPVTTICMDLPDGIGPGESFKLGFKIRLPEDVECGMEDINVEVASTITDQSCNALGIMCNVNVLQTVNPVVTVNFNPPLAIEGSDLTYDCDNDNNTATIRYEVYLFNGSQNLWNNTVSPSLAFDINSNTVFDEGLDPILDTESHFLTLLPGERDTIRGVMTVIEGQSCPIILHVMQTTDCVCDESDYYYTEIPPTWVEELEGAVTLCTGGEVGIDICGG